MTVDAALALVSRPGSSPCVRFYRRADGTVLTADCPVGARVCQGRRTIKALACGIGLSLMTMSLALALRWRPNPSASTSPTPALGSDDEARSLTPRVPAAFSPAPPLNLKATLADWLDEALIAVGLRKRTFLLMGEIDRLDLPSPPTNTGPKAALVVPPADHSTQPPGTPATP